MKIRWLVLCLVLFVLWGCESPAEPETLPAAEPEGTVAATEPMVPSGLYLPESDLELATSGVLRVFPLPLEDVRDIRTWGEDILVFSGLESTTLTLLSGEDLYISSQMQLPHFLSPDDPSVAISQDSLCYIAPDSHSLISLDRSFRQTGSIPLPEQVRGTAVLSPDGRLLYYFTEDGLRVLDSETGADRLLVKMNFEQQELISIHCGGSVLECSVSDFEGLFRTRFLSAEDGMLLYETDSDLTLWTEGDFYFASRNHGFLSEQIIGSGQLPPGLLPAEEENTQIIPVCGTQGMLLADSDNNEMLRLTYRSLESELRQALLVLPQAPDLIRAAADPEGSLWLLFLDPEARGYMLCQWKPRLSPDASEACLLPLRADVLGNHYRQQAETIGERYGVHVLIGSAAADSPPWDYRLIPEQRTAFLSYQLQELEKALSWYPEGFLKKAASETGSGTLNICLVQEIRGIPGTGALDSATGIQYWDSDANAHIAVASDGDLAYNVCHELFHVIESRVFSDCCIYDDWQNLNPEGFSYDFDYLNQLSQTEKDLAEGVDRAFIDLYSMSYPKEDRARIMEYAMMPGQEDLFSSPILQQKLRTLCLGIREAFDLESYTEPLRWEQYLEDPV